MKSENLKSLIIIGLAIICFLQFKGCNETEKITIPEVKRSFEAVKPTNKKIDLTNNVKSKNDKSFTQNQSKEVNRLKKEYNFLQSEIDSMATEIEESNNLALKIASEKDLLQVDKNKLIELLNQYNSINEFKQDLSDDNITAIVSGVSFKNNVQRLKLDYTIKTKEIENPSVKGLFIGGEVGVNKELNQFTYSINADYLYKNKIYKVSYQRLGSFEFINIGGSVRIW